MILDSLNNTKKIECLHPLFKKAFDYLKSTDFSKVEDGKHELDGSRLYVSVDQYLWQGKERCRYRNTQKIHRHPNASVRCGENRLETGM